MLPDRARWNSDSAAVSAALPDILHRVDHTKGLYYVSWRYLNFGGVVTNGTKLVGLLGHPVVCPVGPYVDDNAGIMLPRRRVARDQVRE